MASYRRTLAEDRRALIERFRYVHAARKVVGVGSVGTRAWIMLLVGRDTDDPIFLQLKEAQPSVLEPHLGASAYDNHGRRVVVGQRLMQSASDIMLGWIRTTGLDSQQRDFYVRQLWDAKGSAIIEAMAPSVLQSYAALCGWTLARAHARSGDAIAIASYLGGGDELRPRAGGVRRGLRGPERARLRRAAGGGRLGPGRRRVRALGTAAAPGSSPSAPALARRRSLRPGRTAARLCCLHARARPDYARLRGVVFHNA